MCGQGLRCDSVAEGLGKPFFCKATIDIRVVYGLMGLDVCDGGSKDTLLEQIVPYSHVLMTDPVAKARS